MARRSSPRTSLVLAVGIWMMAFLPALVSSQGTGQTPPPPPPPANPPPPPIPSLSDRLNIVVHTLASGRGSRRLADMVMPIPPDNPLTDAKVALGRRLFFDTLLSSDRSVSCATCHDSHRAFTDGKPLAVGVFGRVGKRHSPSLINRGFGRSQFWDGRAATLEAQVLQPIADKNEMDLPLDEAVRRLEANDSYRAAFQAVFERPVTTQDVSQALASYLRTIRSSDSPYDRFVAGDTTALTQEQQLGLRVFRTKACTVCHSEPLFSDEAFQNTGVAWRIDSNTSTGAFQDDGRFAASGVERDRGKFKVPTLREIASTAPYMHDGSLATLADVVDFYDRGGRPNANLFPVVRPLRLTADEKQALIAFLESLSGIVTGKQ
jgi:cytochrome c peroxidase